MATAAPKFAAPKWRDGHGVAVVARGDNAEAATLPYRPALVQPSAVHLYTREDCHRWFLPQGRERVEQLLARGDNLSPDPEHHARIWARFCGEDAWRDKRAGAASAVGFLARCVGRVL